MFGQPFGLRIKVESTEGMFGMRTTRTMFTFGQICDVCHVIHGAPQVVITETVSFMGKTTCVEHLMSDGSKVIFIEAQMGVQLPAGGFMAMGPLMILMGFEPAVEPIESADELLARWRNEMAAEEAGFDTYDWLDAELERQEAEMLAQVVAETEEPIGMTWEQFEDMTAEEGELKPDGTPVEDWENPDGFA